MENKYMYLQYFAFEKKIEIKNIEKGNRIIVDNNKITIEACEKDFENDFVEIFSKAKLGEKEPLFVTFYFQNNLTDKEKRFAEHFFLICQPLMNAWTYKIMRKYVPFLYKKEIEELKIMYNKFNITDFSIMLNLFAILAEKDLSEKKENIVEYYNKIVEEYFDKDIHEYVYNLLDSVTKEPSLEFYLKLYKSIKNTIYNVQIVYDPKDQHKYFNIKQKGEKNGYK